MANEPSTAVGSPDPDDEGISEVTVGRATVQAYSGPLPPPQAMQAYEETLPGAADRIMTMVEQRVLHESRMEQGALNMSRLDVSSSHQRSFLGAVLGAMVAIVIVAGGAYMAYLGHAEAGAAVIGGTIVGMAGTFVYGTRRHANLDR